MVDLNGIELKNRFLVAAGALEYGRGWLWERPLIKLGLIDPTIFGAIVTKTLTLEPSAGNYIDPFEFEKRSLLSHFCHISERKRVLKKIPGGWMNNMGWWNVGINYWIWKIYPKLKDVSIIPSIGGNSYKEYLRLIRRLNALDITAIELNISCPNIEKNYELRRDLPFLFRQAKRISWHPLILKIGASEDDITIAQTAGALGINAISAINAVPGILVTKEGIFKGGQSGGRIRETALATISKLKEALQITKTPIIGGGGIYSWKDCQDFFEAGADAVSFGSVHFLQPWKPTLIVRLREQEVEKWIKKRR